LGTRINRKVVLMSQGADGEIASRAFRIRGVYRSQMADTEKTFVFVPLHTVRKMLKLGDDATEIGITLPGDRMADTDLSPLTESLSERLTGRGVIVEDWRQMLPAMNAYLEMFDAFLYIWYLVVFVAMGFGIVNTVLMAVYERMREFGLLKALGMRPVRIFRMVLRETLFLLARGDVGDQPGDPAGCDRRRSFDRQPHGTYPGACGGYLPGGKGGTVYTGGDHAACVKSVEFTHQTGRIFYLFIQPVL